MQSRLLFALLPCLIFLSCRNDFTLEADSVDIPVTYAYLNAADTTHYVRVQRAFLEAGGDAGAVAKDESKVFYGPTEATVVLTNQTTGASRELERVDGNEVGLLREEGVFVNAPNILYRVTDAELPLSPGQAVELRIQRPDETDAVATTQLLRPLEINRPTTTVRIDDYRRPLVLNWTSGPDAAVFSIRFHFNLRELYPDDASRDRNLQLTYELTDRYRPDESTNSGQVRFEVEPESIYRFLGESLEEIPGVIRRLEGFDLEITGAGVEIARLLALESANIGITSTQALPRYSNVTGGEGIITSRSVAVQEDISFDAGSLDSLREGFYTRRLGFR